MGETVPTEPLAESDLDQALRALDTARSLCDVALPTLKGLNVLLGWARGDGRGVFSSESWRLAL